MAATQVFFFVPFLVTTFFAGPGAGMGILVAASALAVVAVAAVAVAWSFPAIRHAEDLIPDADNLAAGSAPVPDTPAPAAAPEGQAAASPAGRDASRESGGNAGNAAAAA